MWKGMCRDGHGLVCPAPWCSAGYLTRLFFLPPQEYEEGAREFKLKVDDTERRLGAIFCQAFEDASGLEHAFKVWDINLSLPPKIFTL